MRKLKLFFACLLMAVLSIGQVWADDPAAVGTTLFSENFSSYSANNVPSGSVTTATGRVVYGNGSVTYTCTASGTKIYNENTGGGTAPEILVAKNGGTFVIAGIPSGGAKVITVSLTQNNQALNVAPSGTGYSGSVSGKPGAVGTRTFDITVADGADATFTLTFTGSGSSNVRVDNILVTVKTAGEGAAPVTPTCATPTFDPEDGETFTDDIDVEIAAESGTTIYYTTDGNDPTTSSSVYSSALNFTETTTLKAMAVKEGSNNSAIATATYTKVEPFSGSILEIVKGDFNTTSYDANNGDHEKSGITFTTNKVYQSGSSIQFQKTNGLLYNKTDLGEIAKIEITTYTGKANNLVVYSGTTENPTSGAVTGSTSGSVTTYTFASGKGFFAIKCNSTGASNVDPIKIYYVYSAPAVATPSISGATPFATTTTVTLGCTTDGASIYYTTDGSDPSSSSTLYEDPFELNTGATVKAIAILGSDQSSIASKEFEKVASYTTLADIFTKATEVGNTATDIYVTFGGWKVSAKTSNNVFLTDGTNGAVIYGNGHGFNAGDVLTGTVACKVQLYKGFAELTSLNSGTAGLTVTAGSVGDPEVKTWGQLSAVNTGALVKLENLTYDGTSLSDGVNTIPTYTTFYTATFEAGKSYNLSGVYQYYESAGQILPRSAADVEEIIETFTVTYNNAPENGTLTIKNGDDVVASGSAVNEGTVLDIVTSPAEGYKLKEVQVNGSAYTETTLELTEDVVIAAEFELNEAPLVETYILSEIGEEKSHLEDGQRVGDKDNLPLTAASCSKTFVGWSANASCTVAPEYAPGAEITLEANNKFYAVYADANVVAPTDHALGSLTVGGTSGNTASEGYTYTSNKTNDKAGYTQDSGTKDADIIHLQIKAASQIINEEPSAIIVTAHLGAGADRETLTYPVNAVLVDADGNNVGDPVVLTNSIPDKNGDDFSANLPTANYANVRGVKISHMKEDGWNVRYYSMSFKYQTGGTTYDNYSTECEAQVATPVIAGVEADGVYTEGKEISITCATDGATIYYAVDSDEEPSTEYTSAFTVDTDGAHTIKAKAVKTDMAASEVASVSFTINLPVVLSTIPDIFEAATSTQTEVNIAMDNWVVSGVGTDEKTVYVTDGTNGFIIYNSDHGFAVGDILSGTITCDLKKYKGAAELIGVTTSTTGLSVATGGTITPAAVAPADLAGVNTGALISLSSWKYDGSNLTNGTTEIQPYTTLYNFGETFVEDNYYNVSGIYLQFDSKKEILPRSAADIVPVELADPEISYTPASATIELGQSLPGTEFANPHELAISYTSDNEAVATVSNTGVIALGTETGTAVITASFAGNATYAAANVTYTITVNPASVTENVVILAVYETKYYAMSTNNASSAFTAIAVEYDGEKVTVNSAEDKDAIQWTRKISEDNTTFQTKGETPMYMKGTSIGAAMSLNASVCNWSWDATHEYYYMGSRSFFYQAAGGYFKNFAISDNMGKAGYSDKAQVIAIAAENIVITSKVDPELAYTPDELEIAAEDVASWEAPTLGYVVGFDGVAAIEYSSNDESVATVTEGGEISLAGGYGTAVITASFGGNTNYLAGSATYTITVNAPAPVPTGTTYTKVTSTSDITDGEYLIVYETTSVAFNGALETLDAEGNSVAVVINEGVIAGTTAIDAAVFTIDVTAGTLQSASGKYIGVSSNSNGLKQTEEASTYTHTFSIDGDGNAVIFASFESSTMKLRYNPSTSAGNLRFRYYKNDGQQAIQLYKKESATPPTPDYGSYNRDGLTPGNYATICLPNGGTMSGAKLFDLEYYDGANTLYLLEVNGNAMEAGKPYIFLPSASTIEVTYTDNANEDAGSFHGLVGSYSEETIIADAGNYILWQNAYYFVNSTAKVGANRAYIHMAGVPTEPSTPQVGQAPRRRVGMTVHGEQVATGIDELNASEAPVKMIINGQLFILRGEKMFDATGRLVK